MRMADLVDAVPSILLSSLEDQLKRIDALETDLETLERRRQEKCRERLNAKVTGRLTLAQLIEQSQR